MCNVLFLALISFCTILTIGSCFGKPYTENYTANRYSKCPIVSALKNLEEANLPLLPSKPDTLNKTPSVPDLIYEIKIASINDLSPIDFDYNEYVKRYITIYSVERREQVSKMLGLAELYFPMFDEILDKHQLPLELKYLAVLESALNPLAVSTSGAVGLWQFKINTGRMFDLKVNSYIDERMDPIKSTEAACLYLKYLYRIFNDWNLALAAYNAGPGAVRNAILRSEGETNFWKLRDHLPEAAQNYVPAFIAATYIMQNAKEHNIAPDTPHAQYMQTDTIIVHNPIAFSSIAQAIDIPEDYIRFLNPTYRRGIVPKSSEGYAVRLPVSKIEDYIRNEDKIARSVPQSITFHDIEANTGSTENRVKVTHKVLADDYLHKIAVQYNCTVNDIRIWNPSVESDLNIGQPIIVWVDKQTYEILQNTKAMP